MTQTHIDQLLIPTGKRITQKGALLAYFRTHGSLTRRDAALYCGIYELSSRIGELEKDGHAIARTRESVETRFGGKSTVTRYWYQGEL
jgi:hypothetical protein